MSPFQFYGCKKRSERFPMKNQHLTDALEYANLIQSNFRILFNFVHVDCVNVHDRHEKSYNFRGGFY